VGIEIDFGTANAKQKLFFESRTLYTAYGGARGGGKSWAVRVKAVGGAIVNAGIRVLILRRTYPELQQNHIEPIRAMVPEAVGKYSATQHTMYFVNGSIIKFGHFRGQSDFTEYQGQEYDWIFMDEATQFSESDFRFLGGCLRGVSEVSKRFYLTCNPGGIGHRWVKRLFIDRDFKTGCGDEGERENPDDYSFIFATVSDNKALLKSSPAYVSMLASLPPSIRRAHRYGDWDAMTGVYFSEFCEEEHTCRPFRIPGSWARYRAFDYGLDCFACLWVAVSPSGRCYVYREIAQSGLIVREAAQAIRENELPDETVRATFAPPDIWSRQKDSGRSMAEIFALSGIGLIKASNNRVAGHLLIREMLAPGEDASSQLVIFSSCKRLISDLSCILADENNPNDCARYPHDVTHIVDALRYFCVSRTLPPERQTDFYEDEAPSYQELFCGGEAKRGYL